MTNKHGETRRMICQTVQRNSLKIWWTEELQPQAVKHLVLTSRTTQNLYQKCDQESTIYLRIFRGNLVSSGYVAQGDAQAVSDMALTSTQFCNISLSFLCFDTCPQSVSRNRPLNRRLFLAVSRTTDQLMSKSQEMVLIPRSTHNRHLSQFWQ